MDGLDSLDHLGSQIVSIKIHVESTAYLTRIPLPGAMTHTASLAPFSKPFGPFFQGRKSLRKGLVLHHPANIPPFLRARGVELLSSLQSFQLWFFMFCLKWRKDARRHLGVYAPSLGRHTLSRPSWVH